MENDEFYMTFNVTGKKLNAILNQRSQDTLMANNWNVVQYAALLHMFAQVSGLEAGELVHVSSLQGAITLRSGARAFIVSSKRTWSLPFPVAP